MIAVIIGFLVFLLVLFTFFKSLIWAKLLNKKASLRYLIKSFFINLILGLIFLVLFVYSILGLKNNILAFILVPLFMHFNALSYYFVNKENKVFKSIWKSIKFTFLKFTGYIGHYLIIIISFVVCSVMLGLINKVLPKSISPLILGLLFIFIFAVFRDYFAKFVGSIENDK
jgi:hypothetical protein